MTQAQPKDKPFVFTIVRTFDAPRERVWKAWTDAQQLKQWFGPKGCNMIYSSIDLRPGGAAHYGMNFNGIEMWGKWTYRELKAPEKMVAIVAFTDKSGKKILPHPGMPGWPREILSTVHFVAKGNKTEIVVEWQPYNPTGEECKVFEEGQSSMQGGWGGSFDQLADFLSKHT